MTTASFAEGDQDMSFRDHNRTELSECMIDTARDRFGGVWTLVTTANAEDVVITPNGTHVLAGPCDPALDGYGEAFFAFITETYA